MSVKTEVIAFTDGKTTYLKEQRDSINSSWVMINDYKTVRGFSYEQVLEWAWRTGAAPITSGQTLCLNLKCYEDSL